MADVKEPAPADVKEPTPGRAAQFVSVGFTPGDARPGILFTSVGLLIVSIGLILMPLAVLGGPARRAGFRLELGQVPQGVSLHRVQTERVFLIREAQEIRGFDAQTPRSLNQLWWCPNEQVFLSPRDGIIFNPGGRLLRGSAPTNMIEFEVEVVAEVVFLRPTEPFEIADAQPVPDDLLPPEQRSASANGNCANALF